MNQIKNTITIVLKESGSIAELRKDFKIYQKSINNILLDILIPESAVGSKLHTQYIEESGGFKVEKGIYTACKIGAIYTKKDGSKGKTESYYLRYIKRVKTPDMAFLLYERVLSNEIIKSSGTGLNAIQLIINLDNVINEQEMSLQEPALVDRITSQMCYLDVEESEALDQDEPIEEVSELELISGEVNTLLDEVSNKANRSESFLKYNVLNPLPEDITYNKDGLKTRGVLFLDETYNIKTKILEAAQPHRGAVFVSNLSAQEDSLVQTEVFIYELGIVERTITLNSDSAEVISVGDWQTKVDSFQGKEHFGRFLYIDKNGFVNLTDATKNFIVNNNNALISDDASTFNFSENFNVIADDKERLNIDVSEKFKQDIDKEKRQAIYEHDVSELAHEYIRNLISDLQDKKADSTYVNVELDKKQDKGDYATNEVVDTKIRESLNKIIDNAPAELDTFKELAEYVESDKTGTAKMLEDIALNKTNIENLESAKADKEELGAVAFSNDYNDLKNLPNISGAKLYEDTGTNTDGSLTQKAITDNFETKENVDTKITQAITNLIDNAPEELNTFRELAEYVEKDETAAAKMLEDINNLKTSKLSINQGVDNANKFLIVGADGNIVLSKITIKESNNEFIIEIPEEEQ